MTSRAPNQPCLTPYCFHDDGSQEPCGQGLAKQHDAVGSADTPCILFLHRGCVFVQVQGSLLCLLFDPANNHLLRHDASGRVFLDHDPAAFGLLLRHLRELRAAAGTIHSRTYGLGLQLQLNFVLRALQLEQLPTSVLAA